jgi:hypothetical protein
MAPDSRIENGRLKFKVEVRGRGAPVRVERCLAVQPPLVGLSHSLTA